MWQHAEVYNAILTGSVRRVDLGHADPHRQAEFSWHVIWLFHEGYIGFAHGSSYPLPAKDPRAAVLAKDCNCGSQEVRDRAA